MKLDNGEDELSSESFVFLDSESGDTESAISESTGSHESIPTIEGDFINDGRSGRDDLAAQTAKKWKSLGDLNTNETNDSDKFVPRGAKSYGNLSPEISDEDRSSGYGTNLSASSSSSDLSLGSIVDYPNTLSDTPSKEISPASVVNNLENDSENGLLFRLSCVTYKFADSVYKAFNTGAVFFSKPPNNSMHNKLENVLHDTSKTLSYDLYKKAISQNTNDDDTVYSGKQLLTDIRREGFRYNNQPIIEITKSKNINIEDYQDHKSVFSQFKNSAKLLKEIIDPNMSDPICEFFVQNFHQGSLGGIATDFVQACFDKVCALLKTEVIKSLTEYDLLELKTSIEAALLSVANKYRIFGLTKTENQTFGAYVSFPILTPVETFLLKLSELSQNQRALIDWLEIFKANCDESADLESLEEKIADNFTMTQVRCSYKVRECPDKQNEVELYGGTIICGDKEPILINNTYRVSIIEVPDDQAVNRSTEMCGVPENFDTVDSSVQKRSEQSAAGATSAQAKGVVTHSEKDKNQPSKVGSLDTIHNTADNLSPEIKSRAASFAGNAVSVQKNHSKASRFGDTVDSSPDATEEHASTKEKVKFLEALMLWIEQIIECLRKMWNRIRNIKESPSEKQNKVSQQQLSSAASGSVAFNARCSERTDDDPKQMHTGSPSAHLDGTNCQTSFSAQNSLT